MAAGRLQTAVVMLVITLIHFRLNSAGFKKHTLNDVITAASKIINYFKQNYQTLSFDGHFGVRVLEGQLKLLLAEYEKGYHRTVPAPVMTQLRQLAEEAAKVGNMAVPHLLDQDPQTFNIVRYQVQNPWMMFHSHRMTDASQRWESSSFQHLKDISEEDRDKCVAELTGASAKTSKKCSVSAGCLRLMLSFGRHGYSLQQQIIYVAFVEKVGCSSAIDDFLRSEGGGGVETTLERVQQIFCSNAHYELSKNIFLYGLQPSFTDLFIQAQFTCPNLGFFEFLQHDWLKLILSWQKPSGCYTLGLGRENKEKEWHRDNQVTHVGSVASVGLQKHDNVGVAPEVIGLVKHLPLNANIAYYPQVAANRNNAMPHPQVANHNYILHESQGAYPNNAVYQQHQTNLGNIPKHIDNSNYVAAYRNNALYHPQVESLPKISNQFQENVDNQFHLAQISNHQNYVPHQQQVPNVEIVPDNFQDTNQNYDLNQPLSNKHNLVAHQSQAADHGGPLINYRHGNYLNSEQGQIGNQLIFPQNKFAGNDVSHPMAHHQLLPGNEGQHNRLFQSAQNVNNINGVQNLAVAARPHQQSLKYDDLSAKAESTISDVQSPGGSFHSANLLQKESTHAERRSINLNRGEFVDQWQSLSDQSVLEGQPPKYDSRHSHALLPVAAHEIAHGVPLHFNNHDTNEGNIVHEYIHGGVDQIPADILQNNFPEPHNSFRQDDGIHRDRSHDNYQNNLDQYQFGGVQQHSHVQPANNGYQQQQQQSWRKPWVRRVLLWSNKVDEGHDDDHKFNRDKHIGSDNDGNGTKSYLYYYPMYDQMKQMSQMKYNRAAMLKNRQKPSARKLLREKNDKGKCHDYMTGLAVSALAMYIRFMVDPGPVEFHHMRLNKPDGNYDVGLENAAIDDDEQEEPHVGYHALRGGGISTTRRVAASALVNNVQQSNNNGIYKPRMSFKPLYVGEVRKKLHPEESEDFVRAADTYKELVDRAFIRNSQESMQLSVPSANSAHINPNPIVQRTDKKIGTLEFPDIEYIGNTPSRKSIVDSIELTNFQLHLQKELSYHMVIIVAISLLCVFVLFKYLRHKKFSSRHRTKFV